MAKILKVCTTLGISHLDEAHEISHVTEPGVSLVWTGEYVPHTLASMLEFYNPLLSSNFIPLQVLVLGGVWGPSS